MSQLITLLPVDDSWVVRSSHLARELPFRSGAQAETTARRIAAETAREGRPATLEIYLRDGSLAGRILYSAAAAA